MAVLAGEVLDQIIYLYKGYSEEHRKSTQPYYLEKVKSLVKDYQYDVNDLLVREPLLEHSGSLPVVATAIYPHIHDTEVDLGRSLVMLAIHDIGELRVGDEIEFTKDNSGLEKEVQAGLELLDESYHEIYLDVENKVSKSAKFAKAVDKITPDILDLMTPAEVTVLRYKVLVGKEPQEIVPTIKEFKHPYMTWNSFMTELHLELLERLGKKLQPFY